MRRSPVQAWRPGSEPSSRNQTQMFIGTISSPGRSRYMAPPTPARPDTARPGTSLLITGSIYRRRGERPTGAHSNRTSPQAAGSAMRARHLIGGEEGYGSSFGCWSGQPPATGHCYPKQVFWLRLRLATDRGAVLLGGGGERLLSGGVERCLDLRRPHPNNQFTGHPIAHAELLGPLRPHIAAGDLGRSTQ